MEKIPIRHINATQKEPEFSESFSIRDVHSLLAGIDMLQPLHRHDFFFILALQEGSGTHIIDFTPYAIGAKTVFFMRPGQVHQLELKAGSTGYLIQFSSEFYNPREKESKQLLRKTSNLNYYHPDADRFQKLLSALTYIFQEYTNRQEGFGEVIKANMGIFIVELARLHNEGPSKNVTLYMQQKLDELLALLEIHVFSHKKVSQYAAMLNLSIYQLNANTKATVGKSVSRLIDEYIIMEAKRQLIATSNRVNQIADDLGYEDASYFIRYFKKHTGFSPEAFRDNFK